MRSNICLRYLYTVKAKGLCLVPATNVTGVSVYSASYAIKRKISLRIANGAVARRSKASVTTLAHENPKSVSSTPADDTGETDWTTYGKVAIFCNL